MLLLQNHSCCNIIHSRLCICSNISRRSGIYDLRHFPRSHKPFMKNDLSLWLIAFTKLLSYPPDAASVRQTNEANSHKSRARGTISHKIYKKLRNVQKSQKCTEVSEMYIKLFCTSKQLKKYGKNNKKRSDYRPTDRQTDRPTDLK